MELTTTETVCDACHLTYYHMLDACPNICLEES